MGKSCYNRKKRVKWGMDVPWGLILRYSLHAAAFGAIACALFLAGRLLLARRPLEKRDGLWLITVGYLAMVLEIIGLRVGLRTVRFMGGVPRLHLLEYTLSQLKRGAGPFIYHVGGNLLWFVPVGALLPRLFPGTRWYHALPAGLCLTLLVEGLQWVLGTGEPDVDDVMLNTLGALLGYLALGRNLNRRRA